MGREVKRVPLDFEMSEGTQNEKGLPWFLGFLAGLLTATAVLFGPILITMANMRCTIFGY